MRIGVDAIVQLLSSSMPIAQACSLLYVCFMQVRDRQLTRTEAVRVLQSLAPMYADAQRRQAMYDTADEYVEFVRRAMDLFLYAVGAPVTFSGTSVTVLRPEADGCVSRARARVRLRVPRGL